MDEDDRRLGFFGASGDRDSPRCNEGGERKATNGTVHRLSPGRGFSVPAVPDRRAAAYQIKVWAQGRASPVSPQPKYRDRKVFGHRLACIGTIGARRANWHPLVRAERPARPKGTNHGHDYSDYCCS